LNGQHSILQLILQAGPVVQFVIALLLGASLVSWTIIFRKRRLLGEAQIEANRFEAAFWSGGDLGKLYRSIEARGGAKLGMEGIFEAGFGEFSRLRPQAGGTPADLLEGVRRSMRVAQLREIDRLEESLATLATVGSTSPYVGLFGTVWGIMRAFHDIYRMGNANLATVARPISEALIATAVGLFAAIPAVVAYNYFISKIRVLDSEMTNFSNDFLNIVRRHFFS